ncbi:MAG: hypothetical protein ABFS02_04750 [Pseudomonadota bacterium]
MMQDFTSNEEWDAGFEAGRRVVVSRVGPFTRVFARPRGYVKRFYHTLYDLRIEDWKVDVEKKILGGFCTMRAFVLIRFQPTERYVEENLDALPDLTDHVKLHYEGLLRDAVEQELLAAEDGGWVERGLGEFEKRIENSVNETLVVQNIRCRTSCEIEPLFQKVNPEDVRQLSGDFRHEQIFLEIMRRNYAFREKQASEMYRQEQQDMDTRLKHESTRLAQMRRDDEQRKGKEAFETARLKAELEEKERREAERLRSEEWRNMERLKLESKIKQMELTLEMEDRKMRSQVTAESDELLRREIEMLVLEKKRASLGRDIKRGRVDDEDD